MFSKSDKMSFWNWHFCWGEKKFFIFPIFFPAIKGRNSDSCKSIGWLQSSASLVAVRSNLLVGSSSFVIKEVCGNVATPDWQLHIQNSFADETNGWNWSSIFLFSSYLVGLFKRRKIISFLSCAQIFAHFRKKVIFSNRNSNKIRKAILMSTIEHTRN